MDGLSVRGMSRPGLEPADLDVAPGACVTVAGPSGAGKSLLLRAIADLDPNDGRVALDGTARDVLPAPAWRRRVIYVAPESGWWEDVVAPHFDDPVAARPWIEALGLPADALGWMVARLSTGERQRLALARALALAPRVLLLDEPTSGLDPDSVARAESVLAEARGRGAALVVVTHDPAQARRLGDRHYVIEAGRLRAEPAP